MDKAAEYENYAWQLYDTVLQGISKVRGIGLNTLEEKGFQVTFQENMQAAMTADEIVTEDLFATIDYKGCKFSRLWEQYIVTMNRYLLLRKNSWRCSHDG